MKILKKYYRTTLYEKLKMRANSERKQLTTTEGVYNFSRKDCSNLMQHILVFYDAYCLTCQTCPGSLFISVVS